jgi:hypothetical protein
MTNSQILIFLIALAFSIVAAQTQIKAQTDSKPSLAVFVVGMDNKAGDLLSTLIGNELSRGDRYEVINRNEAVQKKFKELQEYEQSGNVDETKLIEWGRQNNVSMLCLVTFTNLNEDMFVAQLIDVKSNKLVRSGDYYTNSRLSAVSIKQIAKELATQLDKNKKNDTNHANYLACGIFNIGYPWNMGSSFIGRHGGIIGVGYYLSLGMEIMDIEASPVHYSAGLKFFPYKNIFISGSYGTLGCKHVNIFNDSDGRWGTKGIRQGKGFSLMAGYDVLIHNVGNRGAIISCAAGMSYDTFLEEWNPVIAIKFGIEWGL